jgi:hypothetical protein
LSASGKVEKSPTRKGMLFIVGVASIVTPSISSFYISIFPGKLSKPKYSYSLMPEIQGVASFICSLIIRKVKSV